jgi:hypothetical protein
MDCYCATKRKAEDETDSLCSCATRRKLEVPKTDVGGDGDAGIEEAPVRKQVTRLPQEEIERILSRTKELPPDDPEDCEYEDTKELLRANLELLEWSWEKYSKYQDWVHTEYAAKGFVEVKGDYFAEREQARVALCEYFDRLFADSDDEENDPNNDDMI